MYISSLLLMSQSESHVILASLKRAPSELSSYTQKVFKIDDHMGIATAGLAADGRILCRYMRNECINHRCSLDAAGSHHSFGDLVCLQPAFAAACSVHLLYLGIHRVRV